MNPTDPKTEIFYVLLLFCLFVLPKALQRWRIPGAITSLALGALIGPGLHFFTGDPTVSLLAVLGISSLFLFAGLEADLGELQREARVLLQHVVLRLLALGLFAWGVARLFGIGPRPAALVALALLTPSTGFILDSLRSYGLDERERFWVRSKAIATELVALGTLFVVLQSTTTTQLGASAAVLVALVLLLPLLFRGFAAWIVPHAPNSEFAFLLMIAVVSAFATKKLGVYYLVGAFIVGMIAQRFRERLPAMTSERMVHAVEVFASVFVPFYFFDAGIHLRRGDFSVGALSAGAIFLIVAIPFRLLLTLLHRRVVIDEPLGTGLRISVSMLPTLVFSLVIAQILRERFAISQTIFGGLVIYTLVNSTLPAILLRAKPVLLDPLTEPLAPPEAGERVDERGGA